MTADATANARTVLTKKIKMDDAVADGVIALSELDGVRQTASLAGLASEFPIETALADDWGGRSPLPLLMRTHNPESLVEPLTLDGILKFRHPWFQDAGRSAARAFVLAFCGKGRLSVVGL